MRTEESAANVMETLHRFERFSGLSINAEKSMVIPLGQTSAIPQSIGGLPTGLKTKILGIWFSNQRSQADHYAWNFQPIIQKMRGVCNAWSNRSLSLKGKITVYNALVVSLLQYAISNTFTPRRVFEEVKKIATTFLWAGKHPKIAYDTVIQGTQEGGLRLVDLESRASASLLSWVKRIVFNPQGTAANITRAFCGEFFQELIWAAKRDFSDTMAPVSPFNG